MLNPNNATADFKIPHQWATCTVAFFPSQATSPAGAIAGQQFLHWYIFFHFTLLVSKWYIQH